MDDTLRPGAYPAEGQLQAVGVFAQRRRGWGPDCAHRCLHQVGIVWSLAVTAMPARMLRHCEHVTGCSTYLCPAVLQPENRRRAEGASPSCLMYSESRLRTRPLYSLRTHTVGHAALSGRSLCSRLHWAGKSLLLQTSSQLAYLLLLDAISAVFGHSFIQCAAADPYAIPVGDLVEAAAAQEACIAAATDRRTCHVDITTNFEPQRNTPVTAQSNAPLSSDLLPHGYCFHQL